MALVLRDPEGLLQKPYSVPQVSDLRLFTAGSESTELTERCLTTGRVLVGAAAGVQRSGSNYIASKRTRSLPLPSGQ